MPAATANKSQLMSECTGDRWVKHMIYGTGRILQIGGPSLTATGLRRTLFEAFQILEVNRAIMYGDDTFLADPSWIDLPFGVNNRPSHCSHQLHEMLQLMAEVASFSKRLGRTQLAVFIHSDQRTGSLSKLSKLPRKSASQVL